MKKTDLLLAVILLPFITIAQINPGNNFTVRVRISNINKNTRVYLAYQVDGKKIIDSAIAKNEIYLIYGNVDRPLDATLITNNEGLGIQSIIKKTKRGENIDALKFYIHPGTVTIKTDKLIADAIITGSVINADNEKLKNRLKPIEDEQLCISNQLRAGNYIYKGNEAPPNRSLTADEILLVHTLTSRLNALKAAKKPILKKYILANPNSYVSLVALKEYAGTIPELQVIEPMFDHLSTSVKNSVAGKEYYKYLLDHKKIVTGSTAPEFIQDDTEGKPVSLASFKGKYVLLDFWASWCGPCRKENPELVKIFNDFKDKNFTILGISLDAADGKNSWLKAISDDHLNWTQVSDLKHWDNEVAKLYNIDFVPESFLIDPNGIIIAKGLDHNKLRKKLEEILLK